MPDGELKNAVFAALPYGRSAIGIAHAAQELISRGVPAESLHPLISADWTAVGQQLIAANNAAAAGAVPPPPPVVMTVEHLAANGAAEHVHRVQAKLHSLLQLSCQAERQALAQQLPDMGTAAPAGVERRQVAEARMLSQRGCGSMAFTRRAPEVPRMPGGGAGLIEPAQHLQYSLSLRRALGRSTSYEVGECPNCPGAQADSQHALTCGNIGQQTGPHDEVVRALERVIREDGVVSSIQHECLTCFDGPRAAERAWRMDTFVPAGALSQAPDCELRKALLVDTTLRNPTCRTSIQRERSNMVPGAVAAQGEAEKAHTYVGTYLSTISHLVCFSVETFGLLGSQGSHFLGQLAEHRVATAAAGGVALNKGVVLSRMRARISAALHAALSKRELKYLHWLREQKAPAALDLEHLWEPMAWPAADVGT